MTCEANPVEFAPTNTMRAVSRNVLVMWQEYKGVFAEQQ
jgi:hypothetical protein